MTERMGEPPDHTSLLAMKLMIGSAKHASTTLESLSSWMLAGFGAVLGLILSQLQGLSTILDIGHVRVAGLAYIISVIPAFFAKVLGAMLTAAGNGAKDGEEFGAKIDQSGGTIDSQELYRLLSEDTRWPLSWINRKAMQLALANDIAGLGRLARDRSNLQMIWVFSQTILTALAAAVLVLGVKVA